MKSSNFVLKLCIFFSKLIWIHWALCISIRNLESAWQFSTKEKKNLLGFWFVWVDSTDQYVENLNNIKCSDPWPQCISPLFLMFFDFSQKWFLVLMISILYIFHQIYLKGFDFLKSQYPVYFYFDFWLYCQFTEI